MSAPSADQMKCWLAAVASDQDRAAFGELFCFFAPRVASFMQRGGLSPLRGRGHRTGDDGRRLA